MGSAFEERSALRLVHNGAREARSGTRARRSLALNCPGCGTSVDDGTAICPQCDYIIDASFLSAEAPPDSEGDDAPAGGNATFVGPAPTAPPARKPAAKATAPSGAPARTTTTGSVPRTSTGSVPRTSTGSVPRAASGSAPTRRDTNAVPRAAARPQAARPKPKPAPDPQEQFDAELEAMSEPEPASEPDWRIPRDPAPAPRPAYSSPAVSRHGLEAQEEQLAEMKHFLTDLSRPDQLAFWGALVVVVLGFFPWKETVQEGEVMGLMTLGIIGVAAAALSLAALVIRVRGTFPRLGVVLPWLVQLGASCFGVIWCLIFIKLSYNGQKVHALVGNTEVQISTPSFGAWAALLSFVVSAAGTLLGLKEKPL